MIAAPPAPTREMLEEGISYSERRVGRAHEKLRAAQEELENALAWRAAAIDRLAQWRAANPDPQLDMFEGDPNV